MAFLTLWRTFNLSQRRLQATVNSQNLFTFNNQTKVCLPFKLKLLHKQPRLNYSTGTKNTVIRNLNLKTFGNIRPHETFHMFEHQNYNCLNLIQNSYSNQANSESFEDRQFQLIYRFPYIVHARFLSRLKLYQTVFTVAAVPWAFKMVSDGVITTQMFNGVIACSLLACVMLYSLSIYFRRIIGMLYINKNDNTVKVSHMTFWGKRNDIYTQAENIVPLSDLSDNPNDIFVRFKQYNTKDELYLVLKFGGITDLELMKQLLGELKVK